MPPTRDAVDPDVIARARGGRVGALIGATLATGLTAGVFGDWSHTIMPALRTTDDRTFVGVERALDAAILNPLFLLPFFGGLVLTGVAAAVCRRDRSLFLVVVLAFALHLVSVVVTVAVHEPLNIALRGIDDPAAIDPTAARAAFDETRWMAWHHVRTVATVVAFACLIWALVLAGRVRGVTSGPAR